jgi:hypothetical protein
MDCETIHRDKNDNSCKFFEEFARIEKMERNLLKDGIGRLHILL